MKIALINGSPKGTASASALVLEELKGLLGGIELTELSIRSSRVETLESLGNHDVIVFSFPTYVDGIPSHLLRALVQLEDHWRERAPRLGLTVYVIANCGFFEASQNRHSLAMIQSWCARTGLAWGQGLGIGGGAMLPAVTQIPAGRGPRKRLSRALALLGRRILEKTGGTNLFVSPGIPRFLYRFLGEMNWRERIRIHGLHPRDLALRR